MDVIAVLAGIIAFALLIAAIEAVDRV